MRVHHLKHSKLTPHVVSFRGDWPQRAAPQDVLAPVSIHPQQISEVRVPVRELFDGDAPFSSCDSSAQPIRERSQVQFFAYTNGGSIEMHLRQTFLTYDKLSGG